MSSDEQLPRLSPDDLAAIRSAAIWYAKYHAKDVAAHAHATTAYAVEEREEYRTLISGLRKLGVSLAMPDGLSEVELRAA